MNWLWTMEMGNVKLGGFVVKDVIGKSKKWIDGLVDRRLYYSFGRKMTMSY